MRGRKPRQCSSGPQERYDRRVRKLLTWSVVTLGVAAVVRKLRGRRDALEVETPLEDDPAEELRRKLAETREDEMPTPGMPPGPEPTLDEQRAEVHERARAAIGDMQPPGDD